MMSSRLVSTIRESRPCSFVYDLPDHDKGHAIRRDVVSDDIIEFVDLVAWNELVNLLGSRSPAQLPQVLHR
jgi:hypothetical protein